MGFANGDIVQDGGVEFEVIMRWTPFLVYLFESPSFFLLWQAFQHFLGSILPLIWPKFR
jgi:hypothetical protein